MYTDMLTCLAAPPEGRSRRASSWDRSGANRDWIEVEAGETVTLMEHVGAGCINHLYFAMVVPEITDYRDAILRCYWDGAPQPSVEVPLGDFFAVCHGRVRKLASAMVAVNPGVGLSHGLNGYFPMPFATGARVTLENRGPRRLGGLWGALWYHIDYDIFENPSAFEGTLRFHAQYRQEKPTVAVGDQPGVTLHNACNTDGAENYVALDTLGRGRMVGLVLEVDNISGGWYGEGDDMVFVDGSGWPPAIHGTGTEEIFGAGACPAFEFVSPYTGMPLIEHRDYSGLVGMYRWFVRDPISFQKSLCWTLEHGHANNFSNHYASVAYWYQDPPASVAGTLPSREDLLPRLDGRYAEARELLMDRLSRYREKRETMGTEDRFYEFCQRCATFYSGNWEQAIADIGMAARELGLD